MINHSTYFFPIPAQIVPIIVHAVIIIRKEKFINLFGDKFRGSDESIALMYSRNSLKFRSFVY